MIAASLSGARSLICERGVTMRLCALALAPSAFLSGCDRRLVEVLPPRQYNSVAAGGQHSCAITTGATLCWGRNGGQLPIGPSGASCAIPQPVHAPPGIAFTIVAAGGDHTCALTSLGAAYCWGDNVFSELGDGTNQTQ